MQSANYVYYIQLKYNFMLWLSVIVSGLSLKLQAPETTPDLQCSFFHPKISRVRRESESTYWLAAIGCYVWFQFQLNLQILSLTDRQMM